MCPGAIPAEFCFARGALSIPAYSLEPPNTATECTPSCKMQDHICSGAPMHRCMCACVGECVSVCGWWGWWALASNALTLQAIFAQGGAVHAVLEDILLAQVARNH